MKCGVTITGSKVAVKKTLIGLAKTKLHCMALFVKATAMTFSKQSFMNFCFII